jgi:acyl dehydratase
VNRVRFPAPVPVGSKLRAHFEVLEVGDVEGGIQVVTKGTVEREGGEKPVCVAEMVSRHYR